MAKLHNVEYDRKLLYAITLCSEGSFDDLGALHAHEPDILTTELVLRILLTFLPEGYEPPAYIPLLTSLLSTSKPIDRQYDTYTSIESSATDELSVQEVKQRVRQLHLAPLESLDTGLTESDDGDLLARFLVQRAYQIDGETGNLFQILQLIEPFIDQFERLRTWLISRLLPLLRLDYQYYPDNPTGLLVREFESLDTRATIATLLQHTEQANKGQNVGRDLRELVGPWMYGHSVSKRRRLDNSDPKTVSSPSEEQHGWQAVNEWLLQKETGLSLKAFESWSGPGDVDLGGYEEQKDSQNEDFPYLRSRYAQAAFVTIFAQEAGSEEALDEAWRISNRVAEMMGFLPVDAELGSSSLPQLSTYSDWISEETALSLLPNALMLPTNRLTMPTQDSYQFMRALLLSLKILQSLNHFVSVKALANLSLFAGKDVQQSELRKILQNLSKLKTMTLNWRAIHEQILWLHRWGLNSDEVPPPGKLTRALFWQVDQTFIDTEFLTTLIAAGQYQLAVELYIDTSSKPLQPSECEAIVEACIYSAYDNASNGNRTRGGIKRASDILKAFLPHLPQSEKLRRIEPLLSATHSLSFYHLTLEHGVPFQPVSIRIHPDPVSLIERVLEQNPSAYTKLDDLLSIGQNFVLAGLPAHESVAHSSISPTTPQTPTDPISQTTITSHRIISLAITSALSSHDFDTAYSYILTRLSPSPSSATSYTSSSWLAAYSAGRYRPPAPNPSSPLSSPPPLHAQITSLHKRMEMLTLALTLAPDPVVLPEILATWRRCEEEMAGLKGQEEDEEREWDERVDLGSSGGWGEGMMPGEWDGGGEGIMDLERDRRENERVKNARQRERARGGEGGRRGLGIGAGKGKGRSRRDDAEEAPMGLFEVARGTVRAVGKNAFPLRGAAAGSRGNEGGRMGLEIRDRGVEEDRGRGTGEVSEGEAEAEGEGEGDRIRKRDMVSNMVTGGLVKGVGWMLGAEPAARKG